MDKSVLIIDDDKDLRDSLKTGLEKEGFAVITAESAEQAKKILDRVAVGGIILDRMMGGMDGLSFLRALRRDGDDTPVIMLTALNGAANAIDGLSGGADDYLAKPFHLKELLLRLDNTLKKPRAKSDAKMPPGLAFKDGEFFANKKLLALSESEKKILSDMLRGGAVRIGAMGAKRFRDKILANLGNIDIITVRGKGYKLVVNEQLTMNN